MVTIKNIFLIPFGYKNHFLVLIRYSSKEYRLILFSYIEYFLILSILYYTIIQKYNNSYSYESVFL